MTLPSLCSAIRSQLYFSQISAWIDSIKKCDKYQYESGRIIMSNGPTGAAGDLAINSTNNQMINNYNLQNTRPRLNIFYRIKRYDETACFNSMPNIHYFPNVNVSENCSISVCLKSLPRLTGGIPKVNKTVTSAITTNHLQRNSIVGNADKQKKQLEDNFQITTRQMNNNKEKNWLHTTTTATATTGGETTTAAEATRTKISMELKQQDSTDDYENESGGDEEQNKDDALLSNNGHTNLTHREKQLLKYRKRMLKRDKKQREKNSNCSNIYTQKSNETTSNNIFSRRNSIQMISTGTQTSMTCCQQCGSEKQLMCLKCNNNNQLYLTLNEDECAGGGDGMDDESSSSSEMTTPRNQGELLLAAIKRTPKHAAKKHKKQLMKLNKNGGGVGTTPIAATNPDNNSTGCQECKRQKIQHNFITNKPTTTVTNNLMYNDVEEVEVDVEEQIPSIVVDNVEATQIDDIEVFSTVTKLMQPVTTNKYGSSKRLHTPSPPANDILLRDANNKTPHQEQMQNQFKTPSNLNNSPLAIPMASNASVGDKQTPKPNILHICNNYATSSRSLKMNLPKVNLTPIFCNGATPTTFTDDIDCANMLDGNIPVQKSYSAPTLPQTTRQTPSPSTLSPRFAKQTAIYKMRSRHLSDRSDRSSLGSDEPLSDEELLEYIPLTSPYKQKFIGERLSAFACTPLLGNLEESLLQRRFKPIRCVTGFKILLGASGGFCPKQLNIPAVAYFYELQGEILSTPYVCEISLPRKGYSVPRTGTVQVTLLNPEGTVVRMFVVPYDMRDMPPLHQTFIRQRILADVGDKTSEQAKIDIDTIDFNKQNGHSHNATTNNISDENDEKTQFGHFLIPEHMKRLRYSIHLRFQTSRSGRLSLHTDIRLLIARRPDCDTAAAHAKGVLEVPSDLITATTMPTNPKYSVRAENISKI